MNQIIPGKPGYLLALLLLHEGEIPSLDELQLENKVFTFNELFLCLGLLPPDRSEFYPIGEGFSPIIERIHNDNLDGCPDTYFLHLAIALKWGTLTYEEIGMTSSQLAVHFALLSGIYDGPCFLGEGGWLLMYEAMLREDTNAPM